jgi:magnesium and cobalt transporter
MVPRIDVVSVPSTASIDEVMETLNEKGHSRIPVWEKTLDNIIGVLYAKDLLKHYVKENPPTLKEIIRKAYFIPESKMIISLLTEFKNKHIHLACVVDEYGGFSGIVTMEDILEEIVGDIQDEYDQEEEEVNVISDNIYIVDARMSIIDFNEQFNFGIPNDEFDTVGGFLFELFGKVPTVKEKIKYRDEIEFEVLNITGNKIKEVKVTKLEKNNTTI